MNTFNGGTDAARELLRHLDDAELSVQTAGEIDDGDEHRVQALLFRRIREVLATRDRELTLLAHLSRDAIARFDSHQRFIYVNPAMERLVGRPGETILGRCASQIASDVDDGGQLLLTLRGITQDGNEKELELPRPTAAGRAPLQIRLVPTLREDGRVESVLAVFRELSADGPVSQPSLGGDPPLVARPCGTEAAVSTDDLDGGRESVAEIQEPAADFQALIENAADIVGVIGTDGLILYESPSVERILGFRPEQMVGRPALHFVHPDDRERCARILTAAIEYRCRHVDGSWRHLEATVQHRPRRAVGDGVVINARDVTGRREAEEELRETEEKLRESRKMEAVGRLAGGIAHDFNNLLTTIKGNTELVLMDMPDGNPGRNDLEEVLKAANRAALLTSQLLAFSRKQVVEPAILDLNAVVRSAGGMLRRLLGENTILITALDTSL
ncbi:MAG: PAS domain S-box protein, partial [Gemmatimonadetes bacterium]|nr:PAS domain S-box protein [Gemmatimonadota bacterium]